MLGFKPLRNKLLRGGAELLFVRGVGPPGQKHEVEELQGGGRTNEAAGRRKEA
jgi:hypothetical protein